MKPVCVPETQWRERGSDVDWGISDLNERDVTRGTGHDPWAIETGMG